MIATLSKPLMTRFDLWNNVISQWDVAAKNYHELEKIKVWEDKDYHIIISSQNDHHIAQWFRFTKNLIINKFGVN